MAKFTFVLVFYFSICIKFINKYLLNIILFVVLDDSQPAAIHTTHQQSNGCSISSKSNLNLMLLLLASLLVWKNSWNSLQHTSLLVLTVRSCSLKQLPLSKKLSINSSWWKSDICDIARQKTKNLVDKLI